jgi:hypothetical protein
MRVRCVAICLIALFVALFDQETSASKQPKSADKDLKNAISTNNHWPFRYFRSAPTGRLGGDVP